MSVTTKHEAYAKVKKTVENAKVKWAKANPGAKERRDGALELMRQNEYYATAGKEALLRELLAVRELLAKVLPGSGQASQQVERLKARVLQLEVERDAAKLKAAQLIAHTRAICSNAQAVERIARGGEPVNWEARKEMYLQEIDDQDDADARPDDKPTCNVTDKSRTKMTSIPDPAMGQRTT